MSTDTVPTDAADGGAQPCLAMILAMDRNQLIGRDGTLPWRVPGELAYFKATTMGKPVLMGRRTWDSLARPLPGRANIVITRDRTWQPEATASGELPDDTPGAMPTTLHVVHDIDAAISLGRELAARQARQQGLPVAEAEVMIIGGARVCREAMPQTERLYLTVIDAEFEGDTWFDSFVESEWAEREVFSPDPATSGGYRVYYRVLERP